MSTLRRGLVKWFNNAKGFGFIEHETGKDVFVHYSVIQSDGFKTLKDGEEVDYELSEGDKGLNAIRVFRLKDADGKVEGSVASQIEIEVDAPEADKTQVQHFTQASASKTEVANS